MRTFRFVARPEPAGNERNLRIPTVDAADALAKVGRLFADDLEAWREDRGGTRSRSLRRPR